MFSGLRAIGRGCVLAALALIAPACARNDPPSPTSSATPADPATHCFETHGRTSPAAAAVFEARHLQGGGPTWLALLDVIVRRHGTVGPSWDRPSPAIGDAHDFTFRGEVTWFSVDDEAEGAIFCAGTPALLHLVDDEVSTLNADTSALERTIDEADPNLLE